MLRCQTAKFTAVFAFAAWSCGISRADAIWGVEGGTTVVSFDIAALSGLQLGVVVHADGSSREAASVVHLTIDVDSTLKLSVSEAMAISPDDGGIRHYESLTFTASTGSCTLENVFISANGDGWVAGSAHADTRPTLLLADAKVGFDGPGRRLLLESGELTISAPMAESLGRPTLAGAVIGSIAMQSSIQTLSGRVSAVRPIDARLPGEGGGTAGGPQGPDIIVGELHNVISYGAVNDVSAFSVGTISCNRGNQPGSWIANSNQHPVIGGTMYRLKDGRFEQIGQSWLKHGFLALTENTCNLGCIHPPNGGAQLGIGCSDPYGASLNGSQPNLGPKYQVNANTGAFVFPPANPAWSGILARRLQVHNSDLDPARNGGGTYFVESQYVTADDAAAGNQDNNGSYRRINVTYAGGQGSISLTGPTQRMQSAIRAWKDSDDAVNEVDVAIPDEGLLILAAKATDLGDGMWHYEYAVQNVNSDRSAGSFSVPVHAGVSVQNIGFHDVAYHSGEPFDMTDWVGVRAPSAVTWSTAPFAVNPNANALRWGTLYNFRFDANIGPEASTITIGLFKPGVPPSIEVASLGPLAGPPDCNGNSIDDACDLACGVAGGPCDVPGCGRVADCNGNRIPDNCEEDCNGNYVPDDCDLSGGGSDCNNNDRPDECDPDLDDDDVTDDCDSDIDGDGVANGADVCDRVPVRRTPRPDGRPIGDLTGDCNVDLADYRFFDNCLLQSGPGDPPSLGACISAFDADFDQDVDLKDFAAFQVGFAEPIE